jgi:hypothetical protein
MHARLTFALLCGFLLLVMTGCGGASPDDRLPVQGTVTFDGQPLDGGVIVFLPQGEGADKRIKTGGDIVKGKYAVKAGKGPNPGLCRVEITWKRKTGRKFANNDIGGPPIDETTQGLPAKYHSQSILTAEIKPSGSNTFDFDLQSK